MAIRTENNADVLVSLLDQTHVSDRTALEIPAICRCVNMIAAAVAALPIKLYRQTDDGVEEVTDDRRLDILNFDTGDTLNADYMRCAWVRDFLLNGAAYAYIETSGGKADKLYYVENRCVGRNIDTTDPIHKSYVYNIGGKTVYPYEMLKILRNSDGYGGGKGIVDENAEIIGTAYNLIKYQKRQLSRGGGKRGILRTQGLNKDFLKDLKAKWARLWTSTDDQDTMMVVNSQDVDFKELSSTAVDMQLNETQKTIDDELMKLFGTTDGMLSEDTVKNAVMPVIDAIEAALDSDLLLEREKGTMYFAFDTRELTRGDINQRYQAYATALSQNFMQLDEVRAMEDLPPLGINFVKLGLNDVLLDPATGRIYTPNTNQYATMGENAEIPLTNDDKSSNMKLEERQEIHGDDGKIIDNVPDGKIKSLSHAEAEKKKDLEYLPQAKEYTKKIKGVISSQRTKVNGVSCHAARRMNERKVSLDNVTDTIKNAQSTFPSVKHKNATMYRHEDFLISLGNDGNIITVVNLGLSEDD